MNFNIKSIFNLNKAVKETFFRFPFVYIFVILATILSILNIHEIQVFDKKIDLKLILISGLSIIALTSVKFFIESLKKSFLINIILSLIMVLLITYAIWNFNTSKVFLILAILFSITFSALLFKENSNKEFINFNFETFYAFIFSLIASSLLYIGLSVIYASVGYLFEFKIPSRLYLDTCAVVYIGVFTVLVLSKLSKDLEFNREDMTFNKTIVFLVNYIFVPLLYIYLFILYLYFIKIGIEQELPKGNLSWMILTFVTIGTFVYMVSFKVKLEINSLVQFFRRYFYFSLLIPLCVLYLAIYVRITTYGVTEARYAVVLLAICFSLITIFSIIKKDFNFKWTPIILTILFFIASLSPFDASVVSAKSQLNRFFMILKENRLFIDEKILPKEGTITDKVKIEISSISSFLSKNEYALKVLSKYFKDISNSKDKKSYEVRDKILAQLNLKYITKYSSSIFPIKINNSRKVLISTDNADFVIFSSFYNEKNTFIINEKQSLDVQLKNGILIISIDDEKLSFDIKKHIEKLVDKGIKELSLETLNEFTLSSKFEKLNMKVVFKITDISGNNRKKLSFYSISGYILIKQIEDK